MDIAVSVVVPAYNTAAGIVRGIDSLRAQSLPRDRFEVIYVDDGSTDRTGEILDSELADEPNFTVVHIPNSGWPGRPRNIGVDHARGEYVFFMDDDDRLAPEALERMLATAERDRADIVIGRVAGFGRNAPREVFQRPMSNGSLRTHPVLLSTLTVQKLFRRRFLLDNGLRFAEGRVRLEDHMFMLRAYLATERVSVVHDYTCYHWIRNQGFGNISFAPKEPADFLGSVERIFDIIDDGVEPGAFRDRLIAHWYRSKLLGLFQGRKFLRQDLDRVAEMQGIAADLVRRRVPDSAARRVNAITRLRGAVLLHGDPAMLRAVAEFEADIAHRSRITGFRWSGAELGVEVESTVVRSSTGRPLPFRREGGAAYWDLPDDLLAVPEIRAAAEVSGELPRISLRAFATRSGDPAVVRLPLDPQHHQDPAGDGRFHVRLTGTVRVDTAGGNHGRPLTGAWGFHTRVDVGGAADNAHLAAHTAEAEAGRAPAFVHSDLGGRFLNPYWNNEGRLTLSDKGSWRPLRRALRTGAAPAVTRTPGGLRLEIPLAVQPADTAVPLTVRCVREGRDPVTVVGRVAAPERRAEPPRAEGAELPMAVLTATVPVPPGRLGAWHIEVGDAGRVTRLGPVLVWGPRGWRIAADSGLRPLAHGAKRQARRLPAPVRGLLRGARALVRGGAGPADGSAGAAAGLTGLGGSTGSGGSGSAVPAPRTHAERPEAADDAAPAPVAAPEK
ncbi:glycosyltransferase [Streptomonospora sp. S1-112]|uniref:Glycosyltransferase n=1 Tax=Streptomonospora mangrovi TaxID=2883123 RepID=A0A9X3NP11_9ACTN|nr:glycosyltransferase family 2 protein [Streptomonospora mangrovi]MDA0567247.1 glycosyltransferase [Streptomonospora mangrovi]